MFIPPTYTTTTQRVMVADSSVTIAVTRRKVKTPATTRTVEIPAQYQTMRVRKLVSPPQERRVVTPPRYETVTRSARYEQVAFLHTDSLADVALLAVAEHVAVALTPHHHVPQVGEQVVALGSPLGLAATVSVGIVSATRLVDGVEVIQVSAPLGPGSSGAAILNMHGQVIALATGYAEAAQHIGFAAPIRYATRLLSATRNPQPLHTLLGASAPPGDSADSMDTDAAYRMGLGYAAGLHGVRDDARAAAWFRRAAERGSARAQYMLGVMYATGAGVEPDDGEAARWIRQAAEHGSAEAQYELGALYAAGIGLEANLQAAAHWYRSAADQGHPRAQFRLGSLHRVGRGVPRDDTRAATWYRRAAEQGVAEAQHNLAVLLRNR